MPFKRCIICKNKIKSSLYKSHYEVCRLQKLEQALDDLDHTPTSVNESSENTEELSECENKSERKKNETSESESIEDTDEASSSKTKCDTPGSGGKILICKCVEKITEIIKIMFVRRGHLHGVKIHPVT